MRTAIGSPNAATIMDLLEAVHPEGVLFLGKCGGLKTSTEIGHFILPIGAIRGEGTSDDYLPPLVPALPSFKLHKFVSQKLVERGLDYRTGVVYTTNRRVWEHDEAFKKQLESYTPIAIDMETATIFAVGHKTRMADVVTYQTFRDKMSALMDATYPNRANLVQAGLDDVVGHRDQGLADDLALAVDQTHRGRGGHHVVDADHVARGPAHRLQRHHVSGACGTQADLLGGPVTRPAITDTTALGVAMLAGLAVGIWNSTEEISDTWRADRTFHPTLDADEWDRRYRGWLRAVERSRAWADE